jgi:hypothetical protein
VRTIIFVLGGVFVGVIAARMCSTSKSVDSDAAPANVEIAATSRSPLPQTALVRQRKVRQSELPPTDARYDPVALRSENPALTAKDIFETEPRDQEFAPVQERRLHAAVDTMIREMGIEGKIRDVRVECRTLSCYTYIQTAKADVHQVYAEINGIALGDAHQPGRVDDPDPSLGAVTVYSLYRPGTRDDALWKRFLDQAMRPSMDAMKSLLLEDRHETPR